MSRKLILVSIFTIIVTPEGFAQSSKREPTIGELQKQMEEMRSQMAQMQNRIAELEAARGITVTNSSADPVSRSEAPPAQALQLQADDARSPEEPTSIRYRGLTLTPGGFLEGTMLVRTRNENADIANNYSVIPLNGSSNAKLTEFRGTSRNSEFSLLIQGTAGSTTLKGYVETDFLGAAPTANYVESNSWTPRLRQLWLAGGPSRPSASALAASQHQLLHRCSWAPPSEARLMRTPIWELLRQSLQSKQRRNKHAKGSCNSSQGEAPCDARSTNGP